ncbi:hypothetical protein FOL47_005201 [Perkinsus chesapeaki]|uniref:PPM-type phosphatase domain-containing protein n=1 Tax=Perkinsus chesapeaki TaxID=330153 RepID=A0A7J6LYU5_PERCH|nr:hypothetical protein FOL47_005201 [Perkinsus chesapeaki]
MGNGTSNNSAVNSRHNSSEPEQFSDDSAIEGPPHPDKGEVSLPAASGLQIGKPRKWTAATGSSGPLGSMSPATEEGGSFSYGALDSKSLSATPSFISRQSPVLVPSNRGSFDYPSDTPEGSQYERPSSLVSHGSVEKRSSSSGLTAIYEVIKPKDTSGKDARIKGEKTKNQDAHFAVTRNGLTLVGIFDGHGAPAGATSQMQLSYYMASVVPDIFFSVISVLISDKVNFSSLSAPSTAELKSLASMYPSEASAQVCLGEDVLGQQGEQPALVVALNQTLRICEEMALASPDVDTANGGCTASLVCVHEASGLIGVSQVGDSQVALIQTSSSVEPSSRDEQQAHTEPLFTQPHTVRERLDERHRILSCGGVIYKNKAVGVAVTNIAVTRTLGDSVMRSDGVQERDSNFDADLVKFAKKKGCTGLIGSPEWYIWTPQHKEEWAATNAPVESYCGHHEPSTQAEGTGEKNFKSEPARRVGGPSSSSAASASRLYLIAASDGLWDILSPRTIQEKIRRLGPMPSGAKLHDMIRSCVPTGPHDDTTWAVLSIPLPKADRRRDDTAAAGGGAEGSEDPFDVARQQLWTSHSSPIHRPATFSTLDALFAPQEQDMIPRSERGRSISSPDGFRGTRPASKLEDLFAPLDKPPPPPSSSSGRWEKWKDEHHHHRH